MELIIERTGKVRAIYSEEIDMTALGRPMIARASFVEPGQDGRWTADMRLVLGPVLGPFATRGQALDAEHAWLLKYWLMPWT